MTSPIDGGSMRSNQSGYVARLDLSSKRFIQVEDFSPAPTPDAHYMSITLNEPVSFDDQQRLNGELLANTMITGGFGKATVGHGLPRKVEERPKITVDLCYMPDCNNTLPLEPCECGFKICNSCFKEANGPTGGGICPGCNTQYELNSADEVLEQRSTWSARPEVPLNESIRRPATIHAFEVCTEFDSASLYSRGGSTRNYGIGNASVWSERISVRERPRGSGASPTDIDGVSETGEVRISGKSNRPLSRKLRVDATVLSAYRLIVLVRIAVVVLFLMWRLVHVNTEAVWLWGISVVCEIWFSITWLLDQLPKLSPINRTADLSVLKEKYETKSQRNPTGRSKLPGIDVFVSTADPKKEPPLIVANSILSVLAADYPSEKLTCYLSDDAGSLLTYEAMAETANFATLWVPFCRKHNIEPRNPESYFNLKRDPYKDKLRRDFVVDRRRVKREYDEFKVRVNGLSTAIRKRSKKLNALTDQINIERRLDLGENEVEIQIKKSKATWMADDTQWAGTWTKPMKEHARNDHAGIIQVMIRPPSSNSQKGTRDGIYYGVQINFSEVDVRLPMLVYLSREMRPVYDHNKKAGAMNALLRSSAIMSNGTFVLDLDCAHYVYNSKALREAMCFMMDRRGDRVAFVQFPHRLEGVDPSDRYNNQNKVFFDVNMRGLDGIQGPLCVGSGCMFRRIALYGFDPPRYKKNRFCCSFCLPRRRIVQNQVAESQQLLGHSGEFPNSAAWRKMFGTSFSFCDSVRKTELNCKSLSDEQSSNSRGESSLISIPYEPLTTVKVAEAMDVISCWYEENTDWGRGVGWVYGKIAHDHITGYKMHKRGWRSVYHMTKPNGFQGTGPLNLTDKLHQLLQWAIGSVEIFFSRNNALFAGPRLSFLQRIAYINASIYPFTSIFLVLYCFVPALSLFTNEFIIKSVNLTFIVYLLVLGLTLSAVGALEIKWSGIGTDEWWRNEQLWMIAGTSSHFAAVFQGLLRVFFGIEIRNKLTHQQNPNDDEDDEFYEFYIIKWTPLMIIPITIIVVNAFAIAVGISHGIYDEHPSWGKILGGVVLSCWVLVHFYPFIKGLLGKRGKTPAIVFIWAGLLSITLALLFVAINPPAGAKWQIGGSFSFP
ncbi:hypothetical protein LUZ61_017591 [Rhynchospora tenuis]|uniref:Uncharacterized protein n=1 Tax=Rhynchospora tenuis TaxID=198213 RepID=A0AAD6EL49_9POAL|nr:hypothetical protein LUZ61_017591 [Rhynchospora tenuis]